MSSFDIAVFHQVASSGDHVRLRSLLDRHPHLVDQPDPEGLPALYQAALAGRANIVEVLVDFAASLGSDPSVVAAALAEGHVEVADFLLARGARLERASMFEGRRWFWSLCATRSAACIDTAMDRIVRLSEVAISEQEKILSDGFWGAVEGGNLAVIDLFGSQQLPLALQSASFNALDAVRLQQISRRIPENFIPVVSRLLEMGHWSSSDGKVKALSRLLLGHQVEWRPLLELFESHGMPLLGVADQVSPLHAACRMGNLEMIRFLIDRGVSIHQVDETGNTALMWSCGAPNACETIQYLLDRGADIHVFAGAEEQAKGVLHHAASRSTPQVMELLLKSGADLHDRDRDGDTPLHYAAKRIQGNPLDGVRFLVDAGAKLDVRNDAGLMPGEVREGDIQPSSEVLAFLRSARSGSLLEAQTSSCATRISLRRI